jgi:thymidine kinase
MAELIYYCGTMDSGKSTLALQTAHNHETRGRNGLIFTNRDRAGEGLISSRLGLQKNAIEVDEALNIHRLTIERMSLGERIDFIICDEAQFYTERQIEELAMIVDGLGIDVYAFGILADFRTKLFPGSQRLVELADRVETLQVKALCWCGEPATHNARVINGKMVTEGEQVVVGDTNAANGNTGVEEVSYEVLCRRHHMRKINAKLSQATHQSTPTLPFQD